MHYCPETSWYVLRVRSQAERLVHVGLHHKQFEVLNPECHLEILKTPGVVEILKSPSGPTPVPDDQVENVRLLEKHVGACFVGTDFEVGDSVFVKEGPLTGLRGVIDRLDRKKLHIHVDAIPGSVMIDVEPHQVQLEKDAVYQLVTNR